MPKLLLSYGLADRTFAGGLRDEMMRRGLDVLVHAEEGLEGDDYLNNLRQTVETSDAVVAIIPEPSTPGSGAVIFELAAFDTLGKPVFAVVPHNRGKALRNVPTPYIDYLITDAALKPIALVVDTLVAALPRAALPTAAE